MKLSSSAKSRASGGQCAAKSRSRCRRRRTTGNGASGAGKSSLARAGLVPRITAPGFIAEVDLWRVALMRPGAGGSPFHALAEALFTADESADVLTPALP